MAITTNNGKLAALMFGNVWQPNVPIATPSIGLDDQQQLLWGFPEIVWTGEFVTVASGMWTDAFMDCWRDNWKNGTA